jgi:hypothetical protein
MDFQVLLDRVRKDNVVAPKRLLCLDPGETTGWALFENAKLTKWGQTTTVIDKKIQYGAMIELIQEIKPTAIVCENYRVYQHKLEQHSFSEVLTVRIIGGFELLSYQGITETRPMDLNFRGETMAATYQEHWQIPIFFQMAQEAKGFCTDKKLEMWNYWQKGMRHSRDAIRHGCYWLLFNKENVNEFIC